MLNLFCDQVDYEHPYNKLKEELNRMADHIGDLYHFTFHRGSTVVSLVSNWLSSSPAKVLSAFTQ